MGQGIFFALLLLVGLLGLHSGDFARRFKRSGAANFWIRVCHYRRSTVQRPRGGKVSGAGGRDQPDQRGLCGAQRRYQKWLKPMHGCALLTSGMDCFRRSSIPLIYVFGDNEWTDCHRSGSDPLERLAKLRAIFSQGNTSLGQSPLPLVRQSDTPQFSKFRENIRWRVGRVIFIGLNIPGSNNNFPTTLRGGVTVGNIEEYTERNAANLAWMRESFALATQDGSPGLMLFIQGNPFPFTPSDSKLNGYEEFLAALEEETLKFGKPVVLAHGDSHYFRVDQPLPRPDPDGNRRQRIVNFTRVENFGSP